MSKYPLDQNDMQEQYEDLLIKAALKEHARKESARLEQEAAGEAAVPPAEDNVIRAAFRRYRWIMATGIPRTSGTPSFCAGLKSPLRSRSRHPRKRILNPSAMLPTAAMTAYNSPMTR